MKTIIFLFIITLITYSAQAQTCETRVNKLLVAVGSFSASTLYNTYAALGSIADGFGHDVYDAETVSNLVDAQLRMLDNLIKVMDELKTEKTLQTDSDITYANQSIDIMKGLKKQGQLMEEYVNTRKQARLDEYDAQRKKNWSAINKLMGIDE